MLCLKIIGLICISICAQTIYCNEDVEEETFDFDFFDMDFQTLFINFPVTLMDVLNELDSEVNEMGFMNGLHCTRDIRHIFSALMSRKLWSIRVFDSWGKLPSGLLNGNLYDFGDFDQCLSIKERKYFTPQYCMARISKSELLTPSNPRLSFMNISTRAQPLIVPTESNMIGINIGTCLPKSCDEGMIEALLNRITKRILRNKVIFSVVPNTCQVKEDLEWNLNKYDLICLSFLLFIGFLMVASTIYDFLQTQNERPKNPLLSSFSVYTNGKHLFSCKRSKLAHHMECLDGIRVFSALWVIYAHVHALMLMGPTTNLAYLPEWASQYTSTVLLLAPHSVDTFLFMSGLLVTLSVLKHLDKNKGRINIPIMYIHRYLRLTPILAVVTVISMTLFKQIGSGPMWNLFINNSINCDKYWWSSLLYIQNYYNPETICLAHTWYLSVDMQLFLVAPIVAYMLYRFGYKFIPVLVILLFGSLGWTYGVFIYYDIVNQFLNMQNNLLDVFVRTYFPTHTRVPPWLVGAIFAYLLYTQKDKKTKWSPLFVALWWSAAFAIFMSLAFITYTVQQMDHHATPVESGLFTSGSRVFWSLFLCLVIYACTKGYGGVVNWFLTLKLWKPLTRLSYAIYLIHMPIMLMNVAYTRRPVYFSSRTILFKFAGDILVTILLSIIATLAFESPIINLEKLIFERKRTRRQITITPDNTESHPQPTAPENTRF